MSLNVSGFEWRLVCRADVCQYLLHQPTLIGTNVDAKLAWPFFRKFALSGTATDDDLDVFVCGAWLR